MAYSSVNSITGARDQRRVRRQTSPPTVTTVNATLGGQGVRAASRAARNFTPSTSTPTAPTTSSSTQQVKRQRVQAVKRQAEREQAQAVREFIRQEPQKAATALTQKTRKLVKRVEERQGVKLERPEVGLVAKGKPMELKGQKITVNAKTAAKILAPPPKPKVTRKLVEKVAQIKAPPKAPPAEKRRIEKKLTKAVAKSANTNLDRVFGPGETITQHQAALLAEAQGLPGRTYGQIAQGESNFVPTAVGTDPGGTHGLGLWQMTPGVQSRETKKAWDAIAKEHPGGYKNPVAAAEMAKYLAGDSTGVSNYYGTDSVTDPDAHLPGGPAKAREQLSSKPVPKTLVRKARATLGAKKTKEITNAGAPDAAPKKLPGNYAGAQSIIRELIGPYAKTQDWKDKEAREGTGSLHDIDNPASYAADLDADEAIVDQIAKKLAKENPGISPETVKYGQTGLESGLTYKGYAIEWLPYDHGSGPHVHIGAEWTGGTAPAGTTFGGPVGTSTSSAVASGVAAPATSAATSSPASLTEAKSTKKRKAKRVDNKARQALIRELIAEGPLTTPQVETVEAPTSARTKVSLGL